MLPQLFFIGLYTFLSSAIELEGFKDITNELQHSQVLHLGWSVYAIDIPVDIDELERIKKCAKACLDAKYVCKVFIVTTFQNFVDCTLFRIPASQITTSDDHYDGSSVIFETFEPEPLEPVIERFFYDYKIPEKDWVDRLVNGYGLAWHPAHEYFSRIIRACKTVMYSEPAIAIDFVKWTGDISESQRPITELEAFSDQKILGLAKSWEEFSEKTESYPYSPLKPKKEPSESFATIFLTFLDIFCPHIRQGTTTIYDPIKQVLFIDNEDIHILVASIGPHRYAMVRDHYSLGQDCPKSNDDSEVVVYMTYIENNLDDKMKQKEALDLFQQAMKLKTTMQYSQDISYNLDAITDMLFTVLGTLIKPDASLYYNPGPSGQKFFRDLVTAVLSHIYGKRYESTQMFSALNTALQSDKFTDISVIPEINL